MYKLLCSLLVGKNVGLSVVWFERIFDRLSSARGRPITERIAGTLNLSLDRQILASSRNITPIWSRAPPYSWRRQLLAAISKPTTSPPGKRLTADVARRSNQDCRQPEAATARSEPSAGRLPDQQAESAENARGQTQILVHGYFLGRRMLDCEARLRPRRRRNVQCCLRSSQSSQAASPRYDQMSGVEINCVMISYGGSCRAGRSTADAVECSRARLFLCGLLS